MKCNEIRELLSLYIDGMLDESLQKDVEVHLSVCGTCKKEYDDLKEIHDLLSETEMLPIPETFERKLKNAIADESRKIAQSRELIRKKRYRAVTSIAAVFAVGILSFGLYKDVLGILPEKLDGGTQSGISQTEEVHGTLSAEPKESEEAVPDSNVMNNQTNGSENVASDSDSLSNLSDSDGRISAQGHIPENQPVLQKQEIASDSEMNEKEAGDDSMITYGIAGSGTDSEMKAETGAAAMDESAVADPVPEDFSNRKVTMPKEKCSRSLTASGLERNAAAVEFYNGLIEEKLEGFDYQILDSCYTKNGEWKFRIFIFRGKDGNTYNEEISIIGKGGEIEVICSNKLMGL